MLSPINERWSNTAPDVLRTRARAVQAWCRVAACACLALGFGSAPPVSADESADEGAGTIDFPVDRTGEPDGEATVRYTTCPTPLTADPVATAACAGLVGTAVAGVDYAASSGTITFADGDGDPVPVPVPIIDDRIDEDDETFYFVIFAPVNLDIPMGEGSPRHHPGRRSGAAAERRQPRGRRRRRPAGVLADLGPAECPPA